MELRKELIDACRDYVEIRINRINLAINDLEDALKLETKCSMGDKYETGRAMLHLEFEKLSTQQEQFKKMKKTLTLIPKKYLSEKVTFGSIVYTEKANYFIAISAGEITVNSEKFYAIGAGSPIAQKLSGKSKAETFEFNGIKNSILEIA